MARITKDTSESTQKSIAPVWQVGPVKPAASRPLLSRLFQRPEPTTYQRCLAVHLYFAEPHRDLS
jgi:hypothetical protein